VAFHGDLAEVQVIVQLGVGQPPVRAHRTISGTGARCGGPRRGACQPHDRRAGGTLEVMELSPFRIERFYAQYEHGTRFMLSSSDCQSRTIAELLELEPDAHELLLECSRHSSAAKPESRSIARCRHRAHTTARAGRRAALPRGHRAWPGGRPGLSQEVAPHQVNAGRCGSVTSPSAGKSLRAGGRQAAWWQDLLCTDAVACPCR
jgi:hypothetical protein